MLSLARKVRFRVLGVALCLAASGFVSAAQSADLPALRSLFRAEFNRFYVPAACGLNIERLLDAAVARKIDLSNAEALHIVGSGFWELRALSGRGASSHRLEDSTMWYFHWILVADGYVFDFDFTSEPTVVPLAEYLQRMFVPRAESEKIWGNPYDIESMMKAWEVTVYPAHADLRGGKKMAFRNYVNLDLLFEKVKADRAAGKSW